MKTKTQILLFDQEEKSAGSVFLFVFEPPPNAIRSALEYSTMFKSLDEYANNFPINPHSHVRRITKKNRRSTSAFFVLFLQKKKTAVDCARSKEQNVQSRRAT